MYSREMKNDSPEQPRVEPREAGFLRSQALRLGWVGGPRGGDDWRARDSVGPEEGVEGRVLRAPARQGEAKSSSRTPLSGPAPSRRACAAANPSVSPARLPSHPGLPCPSAGRLGTSQIGAGRVGTPVLGLGVCPGEGARGRPGSGGPLQKRFAGKVWENKGRGEDPARSRTCL